MEPRSDSRAHVADARLKGCIPVVVGTSFIIVDELAPVRRRQVRDWFPTRHGNTIRPQTGG